MSENKLLNKLTIICLILLIGFVGIFACSVLSDGKSKANAVKITENTEDIKNDLNKEVEEGKINVQYQLYSEFNGRESTNFLVRNIKENHHPIKFKIYDENNKMIYQSEEISLGYQVDKITLDKKLVKGEHDCKIEIAYVCEGNVSSRFPLKVVVV